MRPSQTFHVLEELRTKFSAPLFRKGVGLTTDDSLTVFDVYQQWLALMIDLDYLSPETLLRDARRLWIDMIHADVYDLNNAFAECLHLVRVQNNKGFKALCSKISVHLYSIVKDDFAKVLSGDVWAAKRLVQLFSYTSRLSLNHIDLTQQLLEDYLAIENQISDPPQELDPLIHSLNRIIKEWMASFDGSDLCPRHSNGGVAGHGRCSLETKYKDLSSDCLLVYAFGEPYWVTQPIPSNMDRMSQTIFVPKSYKTFRTISMEPATLQFFQQGVLSEIDRVVQASSYLRNHIGTHDQGRNRNLAQRGSIDRDFATIDLSSASDSVGYTLVKRLFRGTKLARFLVATRSNKTFLPDGRIITMKKFAPMGSSLCFPIETIIFAAICEHVTRVCGVSGKYSVYGDDIIVPTLCVERTMRILERLGFHVNRDKSFWDTQCWFRESCGGEYCDGFDVTPMRISRKYASSEQDVRIDKLIDLANTAYQRGFSNLRHFFIEKIRKEGLTPLFSPRSLLGDSYSNYHTQRRWNRNLQRMEAKVTCYVAKPTPRALSMQDEVIRYRHWLQTTRNRKTAPFDFESIICRSTVKKQCVWREKPIEGFDLPLIDPRFRSEFNPASE